MLFAATHYPVINTVKPWTIVLRKISAKNEIEAKKIATKMAAEPSLIRLYTVTELDKDAPLNANLGRLVNFDVKYLTERRVGRDGDKYVFLRWKPYTPNSESVYGRRLYQNPKFLSAQCRGDFITIQAMKFDKEVSKQVKC